MNKIDMTSVMQNFKKTLSIHSPEILTGFGVAGMLSSVIFAVNATTKAVKILEEERHNRELDRENGIDECFAPDKISAKDTIKYCWKYYIPTVSTMIVSAACIIGANSVNSKRNAALTAAYKISETALSRYKDAVVETIGEKKEKTVRDKVAEKQIDSNPVTKNEVIFTEKGNTMCYDDLSGRYFKSDMQSIKKAINILNARMLDDMYVSLNEFYDELDLPRTTLGDKLGWNINKTRIIEVYFSSHISDTDEPCLVINFEDIPEYDYQKFA